MAHQTSTSVLSVRPGWRKRERHHADDRVEVAIETHFAADDVLDRNLVIVVPKTVADYYRLEKTRTRVLLSCKRGLVAALLLG